MGEVQAGRLLLLERDDAEFVLVVVQVLQHPSGDKRARDDDA